MLGSINVGVLPLVPFAPNAIAWDIATMRPFLLSCLAAASCAHASNLQHRAANWTVGQTVKTSSGPVSGHPATNDSNVSEYLGIPFGQAPVGDLRFAAPVAFNGTAPLSGSSFVSPVHLPGSERLLMNSVIGILMPRSPWIDRPAYCSRASCCEHNCCRNTSTWNFERSCEL